MEKVIRQKLQRIALNDIGNCPICYWIQGIENTLKFDVADEVIICIHCKNSWIPNNQS